MKKDDLERLEESKEMQRLLRFAKEQYEQEKSENAPVPFSSLKQAIRKNQRSGSIKPRVTPWWLAAACLLGWIIGYGFSGESNAQPDRLATTDTVVIVRERVDTIYREVQPKTLIAAKTAKRVSNANAVSPGKHTTREKHTTRNEKFAEQAEPDYISSVLLQQRMNMPDPESECYAANGMTVAENNYPFHLLSAVPCK